MKIWLKIDWLQIYLNSNTVISTFLQALPVSPKRISGRTSEGQEIKSGVELVKSFIERKKLQDEGGAYLGLWE